MKNEAAIIKDSHFYNMASVFVEEGVPTAVGENRLAIYEAIYSKSGIDNCFYDFKCTFAMLRWDSDLDGPDCHENNCGGVQGAVGRQARQTGAGSVHETEGEGQR